MRNSLDLIDRITIKRSIREAMSRAIQVGDVTTEGGLTLAVERVYAALLSIAASQRSRPQLGRCRTGKCGGGRCENPKPDLS